MSERPGHTVLLTKDEMERARASWAGFSGEWEPFRKAAAGVGIIYPPGGTDMDSWDDEHPSQRAMLIRAIRETPDLLLWAIRGSRGDDRRASSWFAIIERLLGERDVMREAVDVEERRVVAVFLDDIG